MNSKNTLIILVVLVAFIGCSKSEQETAQIKSAKKLAETDNIGKMEVKQKLSRVFQASKYSDNVKWSNGVNRIEKNQFFISIGKNDPIPISVDYTLRFARAGEAVVKKVYRFETQGGSSIIVGVDKELDPVGDGYPNKVYLKRVQIRPGNYSKENEWKNGISLKTTGMFFFVVKKDSPTPISIGDKLEFAAAGRTVVKGIWEKKEQGPYTNIFVTVDKPLDPAVDGAPHPIEVIIAE